MSFGMPVSKSSLWLARPRIDWTGGLMMLAFGHSVWGTTDGYVNLPKGSTVAFYNEAGESLNVQKALNVMYDTTDIDTPSVIKYEYKSVQNLSLLPAPEHLGKFRAAFEVADRDGKALPVITSNDFAGVTLSTIVAKFPNRYILWLGCRGRQVI